MITAYVSKEPWLCAVSGTSENQSLAFNLRASKTWQQKCRVRNWRFYLFSMIATERIDSQEERKGDGKGEGRVSLK